MKGFDSRLRGSDVRSARQLPLDFSLGRRDDASFEGRSGRFKVLYRFETEPWLEIVWTRGEGWRLATYFDRAVNDVTLSHRETLLEALEEYTQNSALQAADDPWECRFAERVERAANLQYRLPGSRGPTVGGFIPAGRPKVLAVQVAFPAVNRVHDATERLAEHLRPNAAAFLSYAVSTDEERLFQFLYESPPSDPEVQRLAGHLEHRYGERVGNVTLSEFERSNGRKAHCLRLSQTGIVVYFAFAMRDTHRLVEALVREEILPRSDDLVLEGGLVAGLSDFVGRTAIEVFAAWANAPVRAATFGPLRPDSFLPLLPR